MTAAGLPFFVYGTLLPGEHRHDRYLGGRTTAERAAVLPGARLYEGPGYPYAVEDGGDGSVHGMLATATPEAYGELLALLDELEGYRGPDHPDNLYERVARQVHPGPADDRNRVGGNRQGPVLAWVYLAPAAVARTLRTGGIPVPGGNWLTRRPPPVPRRP